MLQNPLQEKDDIMETMEIDLVETRLAAQYWVPKESLEVEDYDELRASLTLSKTNSVLPTQQQTEVQLYSETPDFVKVPRFYGLSKFGDPQQNALVWAAAPSSPLFFNGTLDHKRRQHLAVDAVLQHWKQNTDCPAGAVLVMPCGFGKTCCALKIACEVSQRTLVVVPTVVLAEQWLDRMQVFAPRAQKRVVQGSQTEADVEGLQQCDFVICTIHSLSMCDLPDSFTQLFGCVVVDEAHKLFAPTFQLAMRQIAPAFVLSLSATPERGDGLHQAMPFLLGDIVFRVQRPTNEKVLVHQIVVGGLKLREKKRKIQGTVVYSTANMITQLAEHRGRTVMLRNLIDSLSREGRVILVLSDRVSLLTQLHDMLQGDVGLLTGATPQQERSAESAHSILLSTYALCREGFDKPALDTLVMATPVTSLEQCIGRIQRGGSKKTPLVVDICDSFSIFPRYAMKRSSFYSRKKYTVKHSSCEEYLSESELKKF